MDREIIAKTAQQIGGRQTERWKDVQTGEQTDEQTDGKTDGQAGRYPNK